MKFVIVTEGTWGDILPFMYIGKELKQRGHRVVMCTNEFYKDFALKNNLEFVQTTPKEMRQRMLSDKKIWSPVGSLFRLSKYIGEIFGYAYPIIKETVGSDDILITHTFSFAGKVIADTKKLKQISILISPIQARTRFQLPIIFGNMNPNKWPRIFRKYFYEVGDTLLLDRLAPSVVNKTLASEGLKSIKSFMDYGVSKELSIGLWSEWYCPVKEDQKSFLKLSGFPHNVIISKEEDVELIDWINKGDKPIIVTMGSGYFFNKKLVQIVTEVSKKINKRFVVIAQEDNFKNSDMIVFRQHVDLKKVLPTCSVFVHHGGAGSCAQAITTGIPSIIVPMAHDQPDNAYHIEKNKLGLSIPETKLNAEILLEKIVKILGDEEIQNNVKGAKEECASIDGIIHTVDIIEFFVKSK